MNIFNKHKSLLQKILATLVVIAIAIGSFNLYLSSISFKEKDIIWANCGDHLYAGQKMKCEFGLSPSTNLDFVDKKFEVSVYSAQDQKVLTNPCLVEKHVVVCRDIDTKNITWMVSKLSLDLGNKPVFNTTFKTLYPLKKGVNLTRWFRYGDKTSNNYLNYVSDANLQQIKSLGFDHVRLPLEVTEFYNNPKTFDYLGLAVNKILSSGMAVVVDAHSQSLNRDIEASAEARKKYKIFWAQLSNFLKNFDEQRVILELYNEPIFIDNDKAWSDFQMDLYNTVRGITPNHTIVLTGNESSNFNSMKNIELPKDKNILLGLHYYSKLVYSHQGVTFSDDYLKEIRGLKYPVDQENCKKVLDEIKDPEGKEKVGKYCEIKVNGPQQDKTIRASLQPLIDQGHKVWVGEFGSFSCQKNVTDQNMKQEIRASKIQFLRDVTKTFNDLNLPWAVWGWDDCFGLDANKSGNEFKYDEEYYKAIMGS
jgi:endoglucanase